MAWMLRWILTFFLLFLVTCNFILFFAHFAAHRFPTSMAMSGARSLDIEALLARAPGRKAAGNDGTLAGRVQYRLARIWRDFFFFLQRGFRARFP